MFQIELLIITPQKALSFISIPHVSKGGTLPWRPRADPHFFLPSLHLNPITTLRLHAPALNYCKSLRRDPPVAALDPSQLSPHFGARHYELPTPNPTPRFLVPAHTGPLKFSWLYKLIFAA